MQDDYNKNGINILEFVLLKDMTDSKYSNDDILDLEQDYINKYESYNSKYGYNNAPTSRGGNSNNWKVGVYNNKGELIEVLTSRRQATIKYDYTGTTKNIEYNLDGHIKKISNIGYVFVGYYKDDKVIKNILVEDESVNDVYLYDILNDCVIKRIGNNIEYKNFLEENGKSRDNSRQALVNNSVIKGTNGLTYVEKKNFHIVRKNNKDLMCLCCFDLNGNLLSIDLSKSFSGEKLGLLPDSINSCSQSNNLKKYKRKMRTYKSYIFQHFKLSEIPNKINPLNGNIIELKR
jgi:hypothetical protein